MGAFPTRNFHEGAFEGAEKISGERIKKTIGIGQKACFACPVGCKRVVKVDEPYKVDPAYGGPEYETLGALGSNCGVDNLEAVAKAAELCNAYTMDTISTGVVVGFAMECYENGILTKEDTGGIELKFGNAEGMVKVVELIAKREGIGDILAEGVKRAAEKIGKGAKKFALEVKGKEIPMHEPRLKAGVGLGYAVSPTGADHVQMEHDPCFAEKGPFLDQLGPLGILEPIESTDLSLRKVRLFTYLQRWWSLGNCLELCLFSTAPVRVWTMSHVVEMTRAVAGWNVSLWELMKVGERAIVMARAFNIREGFKKADDRLPQRFFDPLEGGPLKGYKLSKEEFERAISLYYQMMGWDQEGVPTRVKLAELDIEWVADELGR
jgi:aldehyde:ferredoxin oxidoreductase